MFLEYQLGISQKPRKKEKFIEGCSLRLLVRELTKAERQRNKAGKDCILRMHDRELTYAAIHKKNSGGILRLPDMELEPRE